MLLLMVSPFAPAQKIDNVDRAGIVKEAAQTIAKNAYNASKVDWAKAEATALEILASDDSDNGLNASVQYLVSKLEDGHSSYRMAVEGGGQAPLPPGGSFGPLMPRPIGEVDTSGRFPVVRVNAWGGGDGGAVRAAAASLRGALNQALEGKACGLVVDFSSNSGGNMWPMLAGLLPIFAEGLLGSFESADGKRMAIVSNGSGLALDGKPHYLNSPLLPAPRSLPEHVAILIGSRTASSGEIVALLLAAQSNSRTFGEATAGRSSANRAFRMPDGSSLVLTTAATIDRNGHKHWEPLAPDVRSDNALEAASAWLSEQCK